MNIITDVSEAYHILEQEDEIAFDLETSGLSPWRDRIALMQFCGRKSNVPILIRTPSGVVPSAIETLFRHGNRLFVGHNVAAFDILFLGTHGVPWEYSRWYDTLIGEGVISTTGRRDVSRTLKDSVRRRLGMTLDKDIEHGHWENEVLSEKQKEYAAGDVIYLLELMDEQRAKADTQGQLRALDMETELLKVVSEMTLNGVPMRRDIINEWLTEQVAKQAESKKWLLEELGPINLNSPIQKKKAAELKGVLLKDTAAETLQEIANYGSGYPQKLAQMLLDYSAPAQRLKMYSEAWQNMHIVDDWVHPRYWQTGTDTLRFSSSDPNFQQIPKDGRKIVGNIEGLTMVNADYSQIEVRIAAQIASDEKLISVLQDGDAHTNVASLIFGIPPEKVTFDMRRAAKAATFTLLFGGSHHRLYTSARSMGSEMTEDEAYDIFTKFFQVFEGLRRIRERAMGMSQRRVVTIQFPNSAKRVLVGRNVTPARILNTAVQGPAAIGMKYALLEAKKNGIMQYIGATVHDELVATVSDNLVEDVKVQLEKSMIDGMHRAFPDMLVKVEVKCGKHWQS